MKSSLLSALLLHAGAYRQDTHFCPDGWVVSDFGNKVECILLGGVDEMVTNDDATILCQFHDGWLVDMDEAHGPDKNSFIKSLISDTDEQGGIGNAGMQYDSQWWIGAHVHGPHGDHNWGNWTWDQTGVEVAWYDWMRNEPNDLNRENCLTFLKDQDFFGYGSYHWNDWNCDTTARYICERPPYEESPPTTPTTTTKITTSTSTTTTTTTTTKTTTFTLTSTTTKTTTSTSTTTTTTTTTKTTTFTLTSTTTKTTTSTATTTMTTTATTATSTSVSMSQYLYLSDQTILSLPSFEKFPCKMDLPTEMLYGTSGLVTDSEGKERLMVCSDTGCFQRTEYGWEQGNTMLNNRILAASSSDGSGGWMVTGGLGTGGQFLNTAELFKEGSWIPGPELPFRLHNHCQVQAGGKVFIAGGRSEGNMLDNTFILEGDQWIEVGNLIKARSFHACAVLSGKVYSIGGEDSGDTQSSVEVYDPATQTWSEGPALPYGLSIQQAITFDNNLYVLGGNTGDSINTEIFKLSATSCEWEDIGTGVEMPDRSIFPATIVNRELMHCQ